MAVNLLGNVSAALEGLPITAKYCWLDSTVALHWIRRPGEYKQFVSNRVEKIQTHSEVVWRHVRTSDNPADIGSRSGEVSSHALWRNGPEWLADKASWPPDIVTSASQESMAEAKAKRELFAVAVGVADELDALLEKFNYWKTIRVSAWMMRFIRNSRSEKTKRLGGPLMTEETSKAELLWVKRVQERATADKRDQEDVLQLNLQPTQTECWSVVVEFKGTTRCTCLIVNTSRRGWWHMFILQRCTGELVVPWRKCGSATGCRG